MAQTNETPVSMGLGGGSEVSKKLRRSDRSNDTKVSPRSRSEWHLRQTLNCPCDPCPHRKGCVVECRTFRDWCDKPSRGRR